jgi:hypothetical protein
MFNVYDHFYIKPTPYSAQNACATCITFVDINTYVCKHCGEESRPMNGCGTWFLGQDSPEEKIKKELKEHLQFCIKYQRKIREN